MQNMTNSSESGSGMPLNETEDITVLFNCLADNISSSDVTNTSFWEIANIKGAPAVATVFGIYFVLAFLWNLFIVVTFLRKRKLLREPANILLLNLAIADLMVALTQMLFSMVTAASLRFVFGNSDVVRCGMCDFVGVFFMLLYGVSMHTLAALSFDRFLLLFKPFRYKKLMSPRNTIILVAIIWFISCLLALPPMAGFGQIEFNRRFGSCIPRFTDSNLRSGIANFLYVGYIAIESLIPIITIAVCSFWTYWFVRKFLRRNYRRRSFYNRRGSEGKVAQRQEDSRYHHQQQQLVKVFGALLISTVVSWSPVLIVVVIVGIMGSADSVPDEVYVFGWICYLTAPVFHPIIESFFVKDMRIVVCKQITRVNRASSFIARSTTGMFGNKEIDAAMEKADDPNYVSERKIQFLGGNKKKGRGRVVSTGSVVTEVTEVPQPSSRDNTPSPRMAQRVEEANKADAAEVKLRGREAPSSSSSKPARRITFSDESPSLTSSPRTLGNSLGVSPGEPGSLAESPMTTTRNGVKKSSMKEQDRPFLSPVGELDTGEDSSSSADGSVFNAPESPQALLPNTHMKERGGSGGGMENAGTRTEPDGVPGIRNGDLQSGGGNNTFGESNLKLYSHRRVSETLV